MCCVVSVAVATAGRVGQGRQLEAVHCHGNGVQGPRSWTFRDVRAFSGSLLDVLKISFAGGPDPILLLPKAPFFFQRAGGAIAMEASHCCGNGAVRAASWDLEATGIPSPLRGEGKVAVARRGREKSVRIHCQRRILPAGGIACCHDDSALVRRPAPPPSPWKSVRAVIAMAMGQ